MEDYAPVIALWRESEGVGLSDADSPDAIARYLERNPGASWVACCGGAIVGAVLCGHDGRRGYLHHLAVASTHRRRGIGRRLVESAVAALQRQGMTKVHLFVYCNNDSAAAFWRVLGWQTRDELDLMSRRLPS